MYIWVYIPVNLRNSRKTLDRFLYFRNNVIYISKNGIYLNLSPNCLTLYNLFLKYQVTSFLELIFIGTSVWKIPL